MDVPSVIIAILLSALVRNAVRRGVEDVLHKKVKDA
jgi:hypothetical protein